MIILKGICLALSIIALCYYVSANVQSRYHRLLPLIIGWIVMYNAYDLLRSFTDIPEEMGILTGLMMIIMFYLLIHYIVDVSRVRLHWFVEGILLISLLVGNVLNLMRMVTAEGKAWYMLVYSIYLFGYIFMILIIGTIAYRRRILNKREHHVANVLFMTVIVYGAALWLERLEIAEAGFMMRLGLGYITLTILYLMITKSLVDTALSMEEHYFETSENPIILVDQEGYYMEANAVAETLFGDQLSWVKADKLIVYDVTKADVPQENQTTIKEFSYRKAFYRCNIRPMYSEGRKRDVRGYVFTIFDITNEKQEIHKMEDLKLAAEKQTMLKSQFLANMSHDLRSPLHAIRGMSDVLLSQGALNSKNKGHVQLIKNSSDILLELVNKILFFSKLEAGKLELIDGNYSFENMVRTVSEMVAVNLGERPVNLRVNFETNYPREVIGDELHVREMIQNLCSNAEKYTSEGELTCNIRFEPVHEREEVKVICMIRDTGVGMTKEQVAQAFQAYTTYAEANQEGTGLGLSIVQQLVKMMHGTIAVESEIGVGTCITISFFQKCGIPYEEWEEAKIWSKDDILKATLWQDNPTESMVKYPNAQILVVDDLAVNQQIFYEMLKRWDIEAEVAGSGEEAIACVGKKQYDMIFLDQMMPNMTGIEAGVVIQQTCDTPLVLVTANISDEMQQLCNENGFAEYMPKPIDMKELEAILEQYLPAYLQEFAESGQSRMLAEYGMVSTYVAVLQSVVTELQKQREVIPTLFENDIEKMGIKVHGMKGFAKQIGKTELGTKAEIMEMAAKTKNISFIEKNLEDFLCEVEDAIKEINQEIACLQG